MTTMTLLSMYALAFAISFAIALLTKVLLVIINLVKKKEVEP